MWTFQTLNKNEFSAYYSEVFLWYQEIPKILRANWEFEDNEFQFIKDLQKGLNFIGLKDGIFVAMVHGEPKSESIIEGHLFCLSGTNADFLAALITYSKHQALKEYDIVLTQTPIKHKGMLEINKKAGFLDTGIRNWNGVYKGRLLENQYNIATK